MNVKCRGIISLWAVAECGIGGVLHALKIPLTGIFVGSISVVCLYFIALYSDNKKQAIIEATATVLAVKLIASPHSPWQAYVAVVFQALMALVFITGRQINPYQTMAFSVITQLESALQRLAIMILVFGTSFISALDKSIQQLIQWIGIPYSGEVLWPVFGAYVLLHLITGVFVGYWLPNLENDVAYIKSKNIDISKQESIKPLKQSKFVWLGLFISLVLPLLLAWMVNDKSLAYVFLRVLIITVALIFLVSPLIKFLIRRFIQEASDSNMVEDIISRLPQLIDNYSRHISWAANNYSGYKKFKYILAAVVCASVYEKD